jgi:CSLREA domain-containing protein
MKKIIRLSIPFIAACLMLGMLIFLVGASSWAAAAPSSSTPEGTILVTTLEDELNSDGDCSLREAITAANENTAVDACPAGDAVLTDTITFGVEGTITVTSQLEVTAGGPLEIDGGNVITTSGGGTTRVWWVDPGSDLTLQDLTVADGYLEQGNGAGLNLSDASLTLVNSTFANNRIDGYAGAGAGIANFNGTVMVINSTFSDNWSHVEPDYYIPGGGISTQGGAVTVISSSFIGNSAHVGGGIYNDEGMLTVLDSTFIGNNGVLGGGIANDGTTVITNSSFYGNDGEAGGGLFNVERMTLTSSTLSGNYASWGGGGYYSESYYAPIISDCIISDNEAEIGGGIFTAENLNIYNSTISGNNAYGFRGGGIVQYSDGYVTIVNSTISGNHSGGFGGGISNSSWITLINTTITGNSAESGGGVDGSPYYVANSIIANNLSGGDCSWYLSLYDLGHNMDSDNTCGFDPSNGSLPNTDPLLGPLLDNGGSTRTHALLPGSPAIDAADNTQCPPVDQRGVIRPIDGNMDGVATCDMGAYEFQQGIYLVPPVQAGADAPGTTLDYTLSLYNWTLLTDTFTLALGSHTWQTNLSTDIIGPLPGGVSQTFTASVTIPSDVPWLLTDTVLITATSVTSPTILSDTARITTQAYAPLQINVEPPSLSSVQLIGQVVTLPMTISNGNGMTLTYNIVSNVNYSDSVLFHALDEPFGSQVFYDASGYGNNGTCTGLTCPLAGIPGIDGNALEFDGDDYYVVPDSPMLNPQDAISFSVWIFPFDWDTNRRILQKGSGDNQYRFLAEGYAFNLDIHNVGRVTTDLPSIGVWHHMVGLYDGARMQIWIDGQLSAETPASGQITVTGDPLYIGTKQEGAPPSDYFYGQMDELMIFDRALTPAEIVLLYQSTTPPPWLTVDPISGTVPTNGSASVRVTLDTTGLQTGTYTSTLFIYSNDPLNQLTLVPVTMTVVEAIYTTFLPVAIKSSSAPLAPAPATSLPEGGVLVGLVVVGVVSRWKRKS